MSLKISHLKKCFVAKKCGPSSESSPSHSNIKSLITDHCNKHNTNEKNELLKCDTETQREQMLLEKWYQKTLHPGLPQILNFFKRQYL